MKFLVYSEKPKAVLAALVEETKTLLTSSGPLLVIAGNYLIIAPDGKLFSLTPELFLEKYSAKDDPDLLTDIQINVLERMQLL